MVQRVHGGAKFIEIKVILCNSSSEEIKFDIDEESTVLQVKEAIYSKNNNLKPEDMNLTYAGINLDNNKKLKEYKMENGSTFYQ